MRYSVCRLAWLQIFTMPAASSFVSEVDDMGDQVLVELEQGPAWVRKDAVQMVSQARIESGEGLGAGGGGGWGSKNADFIS